MRIISTPRRSGKTTSAILRAAELNAVIVCCSEQIAKHTLQMAKKMGVAIRAPITWVNAAERLRGEKNPVIVDNAEWILQKLLLAPIDTITLSNDG